MPGNSLPLKVHFPEKELLLNQELLNMHPEQAKPTMEELNLSFILYIRTIRVKYIV